MQDQLGEKEENNFRTRILSYDFMVKEVQSSVYDVPSILLAIVVLVVMSVTISYVIFIKIRELVTKTPTSRRG